MHAFVTGASGYMGRALVERLLARGHSVRALYRAGVRPGSDPGQSKLEGVEGNALDAATFAHRVAPCDTFVQLVGVPHPSPAKAALFRSIDLVSAKAGIDAAVSAKVAHFVYVSVAHPAPVMRAYIEARAEAEAYLRASALDATVLRPWYVIGPGHYWPLALKPFYWLGEILPPTRETSRRLGLLTLEQMIAALVHAVENPVRGITYLDVPAIRNIR